MLVSHAFSLLLSATAALAASFNTTRRTCGTNPSEEQVIAMEKAFNQRKVPSSPAAPININVYFHVIHKDTSAAGGNIPQSQITEQLKALNKAYSKASITWTLKETDRTLNAVWFNNADEDTQEQFDMKQKLRKGGAGDLNVYTVGFTTSPGSLGYATFPYNYLDSPPNDGVVILYSSLPGGKKPFHEGKTLVHEAGHWVGLYHTFQGGCAQPGDYVADTPPSKSATSGCPSVRHSCPGYTDPIHNYMDYSDDVCLTEFSASQITRLKAQISAFRNLK